MAAEPSPVADPHAPQLKAEQAAYVWWSQAWARVSPESRRRYDDWVGGRWVGDRRARRRARVVTRRLFNGREWAGPLRRRLDAIGDLLDHDAGALSSTTPPY